MPAEPKKRFTEKLLSTVQQLLDDGVSLGDLKVAAGTLQELREGFRVFSKYHARRKVSTFGSARTSAGDPVFRLAEDFSRKIADAGFMIITGAGPGIMEACQRGAGRDRSFGVNIRLPFEQDANTIISGDPKLMTFRYFFTRKLFFLKEADAVVLFPGGFGTHDEGYETLTLLQTGKTKPVPLIFLDRPRGTFWKTWLRYVEEHMLRRGMIHKADFSLFKVTESIDAAVAEITGFYRVFHSIRYVRDLLVVRLERSIPPDYLGTVAAQFADIIPGGTLTQRRALTVEQDEPEILHLPRLAFRFDRQQFGRLRMLIDALNLAPED